MATYIVKVYKQGEVRIDADTEAQAEEMAREMEGEGGLFMDLQFDVTVEE